MGLVGILNIPDWLKETHKNRKPVTCDKCGVTFYLDYKQARARMDKGELRIRHRQVRKGDSAWIAGAWESEPYMAGLCDACDKGLVRPSVEWETTHIARRTRHFLVVGVDPENATSYAISEYERERAETFSPEFQDWFKDQGWKTVGGPECPELPEILLGLESGYANGSVFCPHVANEHTEDWDRRIA